jgi:hypothetical protein
MVYKVRKGFYNLSGIVSRKCENESEAQVRVRPIHHGFQALIGRLLDGCFGLFCSVATSYVALSRLLVNINASQSYHYPALNLSPVLSSQHIDTTLLDPNKLGRSPANSFSCRPVPWQRFRVCIIANLRWLGTGLDASQCALWINTVLASGI